LGDLVAFDDIADSRIFDASMDIPAKPFEPLRPILPSQPELKTTDARDLLVINVP
jgi:hypothetical protein